MIVVSLLTQPVWIEDPRWPGVRLHLRRLTSMDMRAIRARTFEAVHKMRQGALALAPYGLDTPDASGARFDATDPLQALRIGKLIGSVETALDGILEWQGVSLDHAGTPAPVTREVLSVLLQDDDFDSWVTGELEKAARILQQEGKPSGLSATGRSARAPRARTPKSAKPAGSANRPAPKASRSKGRPAG